MPSGGQATGLSPGMLNAAALRGPLDHRTGGHRGPDRTPDHQQPGHRHRNPTTGLRDSRPHPTHPDAPAATSAATRRRHRSDSQPPTAAPTVPTPTQPATAAGVRERPSAGSVDRQWRSRGLRRPRYADARFWTGRGTAGAAFCSATRHATAAYPATAVAGRAAAAARISSLVGVATRTQVGASSARAIVETGTADSGPQCQAARPLQLERGGRLQRRSQFLQQLGGATPGATGFVKGAVHADDDGKDCGDPVLDTTSTTTTTGSATTLYGSFYTRTN